MKRVLVFAGLAVVGSAEAFVIDTYPDWSGAVTNGWFGIAQSFVAPSDNVLQSFRFGIDGGTGNLQVSVFAFDGAGPSGSALYTTAVGWPATTSEVDITNIGLVLTTGNNYGFVINFGGQSGPSVHFNNVRTSYTGGHAFWYNGSAWASYPDLNMKFRAEFSPVPEPATMLAVGVGVAGLLARRRRNRSVL